ncbi:MAG: MMPL family transporter, partial [Deltaproteobacteria bacterium]|nr:MMPL family transporter [Deltaproteobacteria bacterium]
MRNKVLGYFVHLALNRRKIVLIVCALITLVSIGLSSTLTMNFKWDTLLPETMPSVKEYRRVFTDYPIGANYLITVKSDSTLAVEEAIDAIIEKVEALKDKVVATYGRMDEEFMVQHGLRILKPKDLERAANIFSHPALVPYLTHLNDDLEREFTGSDENIRNQEKDLVRSVLALEELVRVIDRASGKGAFDESHLLRAVRDNTLGNPYYLSLDKKMGIVMVATKGDVSDFHAMIEADEAIAVVLEELKGQFPDVRIGTTGLIPLGRDELNSIGPATLMLTLLALLLVYAALVWNYRSLIIPLIGMAPIVAGILWSMGFYAVTVKELNIFTSTVMVVLIGLGIDFSIHMTSRFYEERSRGHSLEKSLYGSVVLTGKGIITGALTTAMAFLALQIGDTKGVRELGFCAGSGVIITLIAIFLILPPVLAWRDGRLMKKGKKYQARDFEFLGRLSEGVVRRRFIVLPIILLLAGAAVFLVRNDLEYEYNMLELEPVGLESIDLQYEILDRFKMSTEVAWLTAGSVEEARRLEKIIKKKTVVGEVDSIAQLIPRKEWVEENDAIIARLRSNLNSERGPQVFTGSNASELQTGLTAQIKRLLDNINEIEELSYIGGQDRVVAAIEQLTGGEKQDGLLAALADRFNHGQVEWAGVEG